MKVLAVINQKGGVGKTTTAVNVGHEFARQGLKVLALDLDPQAHMSLHFGVPNSGAGLDSVIRGDISMPAALHECRQNLQLLPPGMRLNEIDGLDSSYVGRARIIRELLNTARGFDMVLIDCPPSSGLLGMNALLAADDVLIPVTGDYLAMSGVARLVNIVSSIESRTGKYIGKWLVMTRYVERRLHAREVREGIRRHFGTALLDTNIRESVVLAESPSFGKTVYEYRPRSCSAEEYHALALELMVKMGLNQDKDYE